MTETIYTFILNPYLIGFMATKIGGKLFPTKGERATRRNQVDDSSEFTKAEVDFIVNKLRNSNYKGTEFEQFYSIMLKLQELHKLLEE